ncbi:MAG: protein kinase [Bryobacteraceae bacterium]|jgi:serine/threonine protein kinase
MTPQRWSRIKELFGVALEKPEQERPAFLDSACGGDAELRADVERLLAESDAASMPNPASGLLNAARELAPGDTLAHYRIETKLGEGGMGAVYRAYDTQLRRPVALKVLPPEYASDPERRSRLLREARAASALNHPNIVNIYEVGSDDGVDFIAMEFIEGKSLGDTIPAKGLPLAKTQDYAGQIASGLAKAHAAGVIHRDLKPGNIMLTPDGLVKLLDFGLARRVELGEGHDTTLTVEGEVLGTPAYMSPEQAQGKPVDARSDVFSFGSVLYQMVTGRRGFERGSHIATLAAVVQEEPWPLPSSVSRDLGKIIARCLRKDPERRFQHMDDVKVELQEVKEKSDSGAAAVQTAPPRRRWVWAALLPVLLVAGFFAWRMWWSAQTEEPLRAVELVTVPGVKSSPSFSPDGNYVAFAWNGPKQDNFDIYVQQIGVGSPLRLTTDPRSDYNPAWSPDGRWIAFLRSEPSSLGSLRPVLPDGKGELLLIPPLGGPERKLAEIRLRQIYWAPGLTWCPDSDCVVVTNSLGQGKPDALFVVSLETGEERQLTNPPPHVLGDIYPAVSPDGRSLVFDRMSAFLSYELYLLPLGKDLRAAGEPRRLPLGVLNANDMLAQQHSGEAAWMPDGKEILFSAGGGGGGLWRVAIRGDHPPARLPFVGEHGTMPVVSRPQPARPSRLVYVRGIEYLRNIWRVETSAPGAPASSPPIAAIVSTRGDGNPQFSPDGRRVAFDSGRSGPNEIWLADSAGSNALQLTSMRARNTGTPRWSPDGQLIAFDSLEDHAEIYVISAAGGKPRRLTSGPADNHVPSFSRDGKWIYFSSNRTGEDQIWKVPAAGGEAVQVTHDIGYVAFESPDGAYVYYTQTPVTPSVLWRLPASGGQPVKVLDGVIQRAFTVLEKGIYYINQPAGDARLQFYDFGTGRSTIVARNLGDVGLGLTVSPDGHTILFSRMISPVGDLMLVENFR